MEPPTDPADWFLAFTELNPEPHLLLDAAGDILQANSAARTLWSLGGRGVGAAFRQLVEDAPDEVEGFVRRCLRSGAPVPGAFRLRLGVKVPRRSVEGKRVEPEPGRVMLHLRFPVEDRITARFLALNQKIEELGREIAQRKRQERELQRSNEELERFAYVASHDLQEPLRTVASYAGMLERRYAARLDDRARDYIRFMVSGAERMQQLIEGILELSRVGRQRAPGRYDMGTLAREALQNLTALVSRAGAEVRVGPLPRIFGERSSLVLLWQNLVSNALKFQSGSSPVVQLGAEEGEGEWRFYVRDNGIGMDPSHFERVFQLFQRLHPMDHYPGTGVGLAICKKVVDDHQGRIWIESEPGAGATFWFSLPDVPEALAS